MTGTARLIRNSNITLTCGIDEMKTNEQPAKNKKLIIVLAVVIVAVMIAAATIIVYSNTPEHRLERQLSLGNRYLSELEFEQAIACFEVAITIDRQNIDAYTGLVDGYKGLSDPDGLLKVYSEANDSLTDDENVIISGLIADSYEDMIRAASSEGNYDYANDLIIYLEFVDKDRAQSQLVNLKNTMCDELGHLWVEATCAAPRTCSRCGITEGTALEHIPTEADYWNPSVCELCGEELGPVLTPGFEKLGYSSMKLCHEYQYCRASNYEVGTLSIVSYDVVDGGVTWDASWYTNDTYELTEKEGYEWRCVKIRLQFTNARKMVGLKWTVLPTYYYDATSEDNDLSEARGMPETIRHNEMWTYEETVNFMGEEYECECVGALGSSGWFNTDYMGSDMIYDLSFAIHVPVGYDGFVLILFAEDNMNGGLSSGDLCFHFD